jgi:hypothetical protein
LVGEPPRLVANIVIGPSEDIEPFGLIQGTVDCLVLKYRAVT